MADGAFETWAADVIYNDQPLPDRGGIPYFLASKAHAAGVAEGIRQARAVFEDYCADFTVGDWDAIDAKFEGADRG